MQGTATPRTVVRFHPGPPFHNMTKTNDFIFLLSDYFATGEGRTIMLLIVSDFGESALEDAHKRFAEKFGDYYAIGAEEKDFESIDKMGIIPSALREWILEGRHDCYFVYHSTWHVNYS